jgi:hypothetical protein
MERIDPLDAMERIESCDHSDQRDGGFVPMPPSCRSGWTAAHRDAAWAPLKEASHIGVSHRRLT